MKIAIELNDKLIFQHILIWQMIQTVHINSFFIDLSIHNCKIINTFLEKLQRVRYRRSLPLVSVGDAKVYFPIELTYAQKSEI